MTLPNCPECGDNKRVEIVECLGDNEWCACYSVCCTACGNDWLWTYWFPIRDEDDDE